MGPASEMWLPSDSCMLAQWQHFSTSFVPSAFLTDLNTGNPFLHQTD